MSFLRLQNMMKDDSPELENIHTKSKLVNDYETKVSCLRIACVDKAQTNHVFKKLKAEVNKILKGDSVEK